METISDRIHGILKEYWGYRQFRPLQQEIIEHVLQGRDALALLPTGGGKSVCFQVPAMAMRGVCLVVSPLIALMKDQVENLVRRGIPAAAIYGGLSRQEMEWILNGAVHGRYKFLYVSPERCQNEMFLAHLRQMQVCLLAVDEAHCISQWGYDFRPPYLQIAGLRPILPGVPLLALTATATPDVVEDIQEKLQVHPRKVFRKSFGRENLVYYVIYDEDKMGRLERIVRKLKGSGIVYTRSRRRTVDVSMQLQQRGIPAACYHAGLPPAERSLRQDAWMAGKVQVMVATNAFGMGIDKPDVRFVIHYDMPKSLEGYYQETGRAGRDGGEGKCIAFYCEEDIVKLEKFLKDKQVSEQEVARQLMAETISYAETSMCRRKHLLHYFGEKYEGDNCHNCDNCLYPKQKEEATESARFVIQLILDIKQQFKVDYIVAICMGKLSPSIKNYKHNLLPQFGKGKDRDERYWKAVIRQCIIEDLLSKDIEDYGVIKVTPAGEDFVKSPFKIEVIRDHTYDPDDSEYMAGGNSAAEAVDKVLYALLKDLLKDMAHKENLPPYVIFQDVSLKDMTIQYPITLDELTHITGVGVGKAQKYGKPFVELIKKYVEENEIERPQDLVIKSVVNKSGLKVYIIQSIDRKLSLEDIALTKGLTMDELLTEIERIVDSGTRLNLDYYIDETLDPDHRDEIYDYFLDADNDSVEEALQELGEDEYNETEIRLVRIQFLSNEGN